MLLSTGLNTRDVAADGGGENSDNASNVTMLNNETIPPLEDMEYESFLRSSSSSLAIS
ncbi:hypothetical protein MTR_8g072105 [Medicago truncatula]|uniref:Uncharacterized protein n=1 Tax=Medicago truncatula TaxID=3880 RepID=A0A072U3D7_MEDTR|nr:hypothetical protein MTR_8g072105 [Medicago truncatula]